MKRATIIVFAVAIISTMLFPAKLGTLQGIFKPQMIKVYQDELFVVEGLHIFVISLKDMTIKHKLGKDGEGPGEFKVDPSRTIVMNVYPDYILAESRNKVIYFSRQGDYIKEIRKSPLIIQTRPVGKNFVTYKILYGPEGENYFAVFLCDETLNDIKELFRQEFFTFKDKSYVMPDAINIGVIDDKILIEESPLGFVIVVLDANGKELYRINREVEKLKVQESDKTEAFEHFLAMPSLQQAIKERGKAWVVNYLSSQNLVYPEYFAPIQDMLVDGKNLYIKTPNKKEGNHEFLVMDLQGKVLNTVYLPPVKKEDFLVQLQGDKKYYTIHNGKFYYLKVVETEEDEEWEVHSEDLSNPLSEKEIKK